MGNTKCPSIPLKMNELRSALQRWKKIVQPMSIWSDNSISTNWPEAESPTWVLFISEFSDMLSLLLPNYDLVCIIGGFNIHICCRSDTLVGEFLNLLEFFNFVAMIRAIFSILFYQMAWRLIVWSLWISVYLIILVLCLICILLRLLKLHWPPVTLTSLIQQLIIFICIFVPLFQAASLPWHWRTGL